MASFQDLKAGPSKLSRAHQTDRIVSSSRLRLFRVLAIVLCLGCFGLSQLLLNQDELFWFWGEGGVPKGNDSFKWHHESPRTQYLLGVGKADITGYDSKTEVVTAKQVFIR
jgi:hypothetical protein